MNNLEFGKVKSCIGCGFCCIKTICDSGRRIYGNGVILCPALKWDEKCKRHYCKLCNISGELGRQYRIELYVGAGCCANLNSWRRETLINRINIKGNAKKYVNQIPHELQIFLKNLGQEFISINAISLALSSTKEDLMENGWDVNKAEMFCMQVMHQIKQSKSTVNKNFMG